MKKSLQKTLEHILKPISLLLIKESWTHGMLSELTKISMVDSAIKILEQQNVPVTDSRISLATGIHRKEIKRLKAETETSFQENDISIPAQVIALWIASPHYSENGKPKILSRKAIGNQLDFESLVTSISKDVRPRAVLDELADRKIVTLLPTGEVELHVEKILSAPNTESTMRFIGMNIHDHLEVCVKNYLNESPKQLDRCAYYHGLSESASEELAQLAEELAMEALFKLNQRAQKLIVDKKNHGDFRTNFGIYFYKEENNTAAQNA